MVSVKLRLDFVSHSQVWNNQAGWRISRIVINERDAINGMGGKFNMQLREGQNTQLLLTARNVGHHKICRWKHHNMIKNDNKYVQIKEYMCSIAKTWSCQADFSRVAIR